MVLPLDQGLEHGPTDFFPHPAALDPDHVFALAESGRFSAIALGVGLAEKYLGPYAGRVPLILKLNGKTNIPEDDEAVSPAFASVLDAVRLGADAVGYTMYVGTPRQDTEIREYRQVRQDCERFGMPLVMWAYPRGRAIEKKGGKGSLFAQDYAARVALEMGADIVKLHEPAAESPGSPKPYASLQEDAAARVRRVVRSAGRTLVLFSGGEKDDRESKVVDKIRMYMDNGATGVMFGRNMWLRRPAEAEALTRKVHAVLERYPR